MNLLEARRKLESMEKYLDLNATLEGVAEESRMSMLGATRRCLETSVRDYRKIVSLEEKVIRLRAEAEGRCVGVNQELSERYGVSETERIMDGWREKSDEAKRRRYIFKVVKNSALAAVSFPFLREHQRVIENWQGLMLQI